MEKYDIYYTVEIINKEQFIDPQGCCSISFENRGSKTAYVLDNIPVPVNIIREFNNEANCQINQKIRVSWRGQLTGSTSERNLEQVIVTRTFARRID